MIPFYLGYIESNWYTICVLYYLHFREYIHNCFDWHQFMVIINQAWNKKFDFYWFKIVNKCHIELKLKNNFQESEKISSFLLKKSWIEVIVVTAKPFNRKTNFPDQTTTFLVFSLSHSPSLSISLNHILFHFFSLILTLSFSYSL